jgi:drug/metabolite transporter (DMT)-like permease
MRTIRYKTEMLVGGSVAMAAAGQILIKVGLLGKGRLGLLALHWPLSLPWGVLIGLCIYGLGTLLWFAAVAQKNISYLYPLAASNYILLGFLGHYLLHESMGPGRWTGITVMAVGIALLSKTDRGIAR